MEREYTVQTTTTDGITYIDKIKALNELEALDKAFAKYKNIIDVKVV